MANMTQPDPAAQRGWLKDVLDENRRTLDSWPEWKRRLYMTDPAAQQYKTYLCSYRFKGERWQFEVKAASLVEARRAMCPYCNDPEWVNRDSDGHHYSANTRSMYPCEATELDRLAQQEGEHE